MDLMKQLIALALLFAASVSLATCEEMKAGKATFDMGDGYIASFMLPDIGTPYVLDYVYPGGIADIELLKYKSYGFTISSNGADLASLTMDVHSSPQSQYVREAGRRDSSTPDMGPEVIIPKTISSSPGYVGYILQIGATGTDTSNAMGGFFTCLPGAHGLSGDLKGEIEVKGETSGLPASAQSLKVFNSIVDSIKISGPGI
jgi:hypothetical protein